METSKLNACYFIIKNTVVLKFFIVLWCKCKLLFK